MRNKLSPCREICADPELIMCVSSSNAPDYEGTETACREQVKYIKNCNLRKTHSCKWAKQIDSWVFKYC